MESAGPGGEAWRERPWALAALLAVGLALRLAHLAAVAELPFVAALVGDSAEYDRWARAIAGGQLLPPGAFFQPPLYPYLVAALYALAGPAPLAVYAAQMAAGLFACYALARAGRALGAPLSGLAAAGLAATYPLFLAHETLLLKESLAVALAAALLWALAAAWGVPTPRRWVASGALLGLLALLRENALLLAPLLLVLPLAATGSCSKRLRLAGAFALGLVLPPLPVAAFHVASGEGLLPTSFQGGVNFWIGNNPRADGTYRPLAPGRQVPEAERREAVRQAEAARGETLSAAEVSRFWFSRALAWARAEPRAFLALQLRKLALFWSAYEWPDAIDFYWLRERSWPLAWPGFEFAGVALLAAAGALALGRAGRRRFAPVLLFAAGWMLATIAFFLFSRYRLPAVPALLLLAGVPFARAIAAWRAGARRAAIAWAGLIAVSWALPRLAPHAPRLDLVEVNLALLAEGRGELTQAAAHFEAARRAAPGDFVPWLGLGRLAARERRYDAAHELLLEAARLEPRSVEAWSDLGGVALARGDLAGAREALERALVLDPGHPAARHNLDLARRRGATP